MTRTYVPRAVRERVWAQAKGRCGYCLSQEIVTGLPLEIEGVTPIGRATVAALRMNRPLPVRARRVWVAAGMHPPRDGCDARQGDLPAVDGVQPAGRRATRPPRPAPAQPLNTPRPSRPCSVPVKTQLDRPFWLRIMAAIPPFSSDYQPTVARVETTAVGKVFGARVTSTPRHGATRREGGLHE